MQPAKARKELKKIAWQLLRHVPKHPDHGRRRGSSFHLHYHHLQPKNRKQLLFKFEKHGKQTQSVPRTADPSWSLLKSKTHLDDHPTKV
jgi:hypothetical protein